MGAADTGVTPSARSALASRRRHAAVFPETPQAQNQTQIMAQCPMQCFLSNSVAPLIGALDKVQRAGVDLRKPGPPYALLPAHWVCRGDVAQEGTAGQDSSPPSCRVEQWCLSHQEVRGYSFLVSVFPGWELANMGGESAVPEHPHVRCSAGARSLSPGS